jgi:hypothetical protein
VSKSLSGGLDKKKRTDGFFSHPSFHLKTTAFFSHFIRILK